MSEDISAFFENHPLPSFSELMEMVDNSDDSDMHYLKYHITEDVHNIISEIWANPLDDAFVVEKGTDLEQAHGFYKLAMFRDGIKTIMKALDPGSTASETYFDKLYDLWTVLLRF